MLSQIKAIIRFEDIHKAAVNNSPYILLGIVQENDQKLPDVHSIVEIRMIH